MKVELPALPELDGHLKAHTEYVRSMIQSYARAYGLACAQAMREAAEKLCDEREKRFDREQNRAVARLIAKDIRSIKLGEEGK